MKVISSPCILDWNYSFYSNYFSKKFVKAVCSGWNTTSWNISLLFNKQTFLCMPSVSTKCIQLQRVPLPSWSQNDKFQPNPVPSVQYIYSETSRHPRPAGPAPPRSFQQPSGSSASVVLTTLWQHIPSAAYSPLHPFPAPAQRDKIRKKWSQSAIHSYIY